MRKQKPEVWGQCPPELVTNVIPLLMKQLKGMQTKGKIPTRRVMAPTMHDPFLKDQALLRLSISVYQQLGYYNVPYRVLTKSPIIMSFANLFDGKGEIVGMTFTTLDVEKFKEWHPGAWFGPEDQLQAFVILQAYKGFKTWVSFEPLVDKNIVMDVLNIIEPPDEVMIGKMNYHKDPLSLEDHWDVWQVAKQLNARGIKVIPKPEWLQLLSAHSDWDNDDLSKFSIHPESLLVPTL